MTATSPYDPEIFVNVSRAVLDTIGIALTNGNRDVPRRMFVGFNRPAEDCCPDLVAWVGNIRAYDGNSPNSGLREDRLLIYNAWAFDITIRLGRCFIDFDADGGPLDGQTIEDFSNELYRDAQVVYIGWVNQWRSSSGVCLTDELSSCTPLTVSSLIDYKDGGCAGWEFTITVGVM
jgi:hypothetical protein